MYSCQFIGSYTAQPYYKTYFNIVVRDDGDGVNVDGGSPLEAVVKQCVGKVTPADDMQSTAIWQDWQRQTVPVNRIL